MSLDKSAVKKILNTKLNNEDFVLNNWKMEVLSADGMMGEHLSLTSEINTKSTTTKYKFFVKKKSPIEEYGEMPEKVFQKERATFNMLQSINYPCIKNSIPMCYYTDNSHMVFEDLNLEGYVIQSPGRVATDDELLAMLDSLAAIHAGAIAYEETHGGMTLVEKFPVCFAELYLRNDSPFCSDYFRANINTLKTIIKMYNLPQVLKNGKLVEDELEKFTGCITGEVKSSIKYRNTLCHCDLWPANIFIEYDENKVAKHAKIIDYQISRYLPPAFDVLDYILLNSTREYRQKHLGRLKKCYFDCFSRYLKKLEVNPEKIYTFEEFLESFKEVEKFAIFMSLATIPLVYNVDNNIADLMKSDEKEHIIFQDRTPLVECSLKNEYLYGRIKGAMLDMMDYFENN